MPLTIAGLNVLGIINEPTAAAPSYHFNNGGKGEEKNNMIIDIGGGDTHLGGEDFTDTDRFTDYCHSLFKKKNNNNNMNIGFGFILQSKIISGRFHSYPPKIRNIISSYVDGKSLNKTINVNEAVTNGAAYTRITISEVIPSYSIGIYHDGDDDEEEEEEEKWERKKKEIIIKH
ncbi:hypothetical protein PIROE2DRAFT_17512 [Piromyces sp. E2]|nr:hypothetical protein PIROE2DRAFT_17512 [Piromyces sp. E2]|eukprot:OUM57492.1 hypothetical protein PIROE2DRAFT_17512 [Piromyces sp. E2]